MPKKRLNRAGQEEVSLVPLYVVYTLGLILPPLDLFAVTFVLPRYQNHWGMSHVLNIATVSAVRLAILFVIAIADYAGMNLVILWAMLWPGLLLLGLWMVVREVRGLILLSRKQAFKTTMTVF